MEKLELKNFYNDGFGWICKDCERDFKKQENISNQKLSRLMSEGEAESKKPEFSNKALAKWADDTKSKLVCPRCGSTEVKTVNS